MAENDIRDCPYCAEPVKTAASLCPHCRSWLGGAPAAETYRNRPGRQIAGVSTALAETLGISVTFVRLSFVVLTFLSFIGPPLYLALWLLLPAEPGELSPLGSFVSGTDGEPSLLERAIQSTERLFARVATWFRGETPSGTPNTPERPESAP